MNIRYPIYEGVYRILTFIYHDLLDTDFTDKLFYFRVIRT